MATVLPYLDIQVTLFRCTACTIFSRLPCTYFRPFSLYQKYLKIRKSSVSYLGIKFDE